MTAAAPPTRQISGQAGSWPALRKAISVSEAWTHLQQWHHVGHLRPTLKAGNRLAQRHEQPLALASSGLLDRSRPGRPGLRVVRRLAQKGKGFGDKGLVFLVNNR